MRSLLTKCQEVDSREAVMHIERAISDFQRGEGRWTSKGDNR